MFSACLYNKDWWSLRLRLTTHDGRELRSPSWRIPQQAPIRIKRFPVRPQTGERFGLGRLYSARNIKASASQPFRLVLYLTSHRPSFRAIPPQRWRSVPRAPGCQGKAGIQLPSALRFNVPSKPGRTNRLPMPNMNAIITPSAVRIALPLLVFLACQFAHDAHI